MSAEMSSKQSEFDSCWRFVSFGLMILNFSWSVTLVAGMLVTSGKLRPILESFEVEMPWLTKIAVSPIFLLVIAGLTILGLVKEWRIGCSRLKTRINFVHTFMILIIQAIYIAGIFGPLFDLLNRLS